MLDKPINNCYCYLDTNRIGTCNTKWSRMTKNPNLKLKIICDLAELLSDRYTKS